MYERRSLGASPRSSLDWVFPTTRGGYVGKEEPDRMLAHISADSAVCCVHIRSINLSNVPNWLAWSTGLTWPYVRRTVCRQSVEPHASNASRPL